MAQAQEAHRVNVFVIFGWLVALTGAELYIASDGVMTGTALVLGLVGSALVKAALVAIYFMHLKFEGVLIWTMMIASLVIGIAFILVLFPDLVQDGYWKGFISHLYHD